MKNNNFCEILEAEASKKDIVLSSIQLEKFEKYKELLVEWNEKMNLTAITDDIGIIIKHFVDCLMITKYIELNKGEASNIIDVGTGAGFPGVVIAIYFENDINITLLDSLNKRLIFLEEVKNKLQLQNIKIIHSRAEESGNSDKYRSRYDYVVSRAVASLNILLEYTTPYLKVGGKGLYLKGDNLQEEIDKSANALNILKCKIKKIYNYKLNTEETELNRTILEVVKNSDTPNKYPRSYGKIKKSEL